MKHTKSDTLDVTLDLYQSKFPHDHRYQHTLLIGHSVNLSAVSEGPLILPDRLPVTFHAGQMFTFATDIQHQPFIRLLAIAKMDISSKRCGIWTLKARLRGNLDEPWLHLLSKTRHGFIRLNDEPHKACGS